MQDDLWRIGPEGSGNAAREQLYDRLRDNARFFAAMGSRRTPRTASHASGSCDEADVIAET